MPAFVTKLGPVVAHTLSIYLFLILMLRFVNRRSLGQLTVVDLVIIILLGSAVETAMVAGDTSLQAGLVCAGTLLCANRLLAQLLLRSRRLRHLVVYGPTLLVENGRFIEDHLRRAGLTQADVLEALREREQAGIETVRFAVLETDGTINVVSLDAVTHRSPHVPPAGPSPLRPGP